MTLLEFLRLRRGLSRTEAARLVRMLPTDYALVERGLQAAGDAAAARMTVAFGYDADTLASDVACLIEDALRIRAAAL